MKVKTLSDALFESLITGPRFVPDLVQELAFTQKVTIQGVYKAIRQLKKANVVTRSGKRIELSLIWVAKEKARFEYIEQSYKTAPHLEKIRTGGLITTRAVFKTLAEMDLFWTHTYNALADQLDVELISYSIQPHDWYWYVQTETDRYWTEQHRKAGRIARMVITHSAPLDQKVVRERKKVLGDLLQFTVGENPLKQKSTTYYNVIGSFVFIAEFDGVVSKKLDNFIAAHTQLPLCTAATVEIKELVEEKGRFTLTITRSETKANFMRSKVRKYFE